MRPSKLTPTDRCFSGPANEAPVRVDLITTTSEFEALRPGWDALVELAPRASIFMTWEWQYLWWKHYGHDRSLRVLVAFEGDRMVGILPMYLRTTRLLRWIPLRVLQPVGSGGDTSPDYLEPLLEGGVGKFASASLIGCVFERVRGWDQLMLSDLNPDSEFKPTLENVCRKRGLWYRTGVSARIRYIALPGSWDEFIGSLSRDRRQAMRYCRRRFEAMPGARFRIVSESGPALDAAIDRLIEWHKMRWTDRGVGHAFSSAQYCGFHRELMHELQGKGQLRLICLEVESLAIAMLYCFRFRDSWFYFQAGFDPAHGKLSPGLVLLGYAIERAISEGCHEFDMLRGEHEYKAQLAKLMRETLQVQVSRPGFKAAAQSTRERLASWRRAA